MVYPLQRSVPITAWSTSTWGTHHSMVYPLQRGVPPPRGVPITAWGTHHSMGYPPQHGAPTTALGTHNMGHPPRHGVPTAEEKNTKIHMTAKIRSELNESWRFGILLTKRPTVLWVLQAATATQAAPELYTASPPSQLAQSSEKRHHPEFTL
ncbi:hypothetical protein K469DRAFT_765129 [Zopfia rhizophila CBS 207.26]|uniref:Uncharacterized protein n=1 Tax=Zopfia rhizophila CBS 207.26 TaxID=1314779 RepID=A0A6A6D7S0_9PEZI|nr:hypothetical protein K469DRAFT_765129 [Zopfia rhizophila CBS 207.26]